jgi:hypothetical protein
LRLKRLSEDFRVRHGIGWLDQGALRDRYVVLPTYLGVNAGCESEKPTRRATGASSLITAIARGRSLCGLGNRSLTTTPALSTVAANVAIIGSHAAFVSRLASPARPSNVVTAASGKDAVKAARCRINPDAQATGGGKDT